MPSELRSTEQELSAKLTQELGVAVCLCIADNNVPEDQLSAGEKTRLAQFRTRPRQLTWRRGRHALKRLLSECGRCSDTSSITFPNSSYSISHCDDISVALGLVGVQDLSSFAGIGIDLEFEANINYDNARFFLTEKESQSLDKPYLLRLWTVKEAIFKSDPENLNHHLVDYELSDPSLWTGLATLSRERVARIRYASIIWDKGIISAAVFARTEACSSADRPAACEGFLP